MSKQLKNAPVFYTVAEVQFRAMPLDGLLQLSKGIANALGWKSQGQSDYGCVLTDKGGRTGCVIQPDCFWFHTTQYSTHREFFQDFLELVNVFSELTDVREVDSLGLRYLDGLVGTHDYDVADLVVPGLRGGPHQQRAHHATEAVYLSHIGDLATELVLRTYQAKASIGFPLELEPVGLILSPIHELGEVDHIVLDSDHRYPHPVSLKSNVLQELLEPMHGALKRLFVDSTTDKARDIWS